MTDTTPITTSNAPAALVVTDAELALLSINQRNVFVAFVCNGNSYEAISEHLGIPIGTVRSRLHRARKKIEMRRAVACATAHDPQDACS